MNPSTGFTALVIAALVGNVLLKLWLNARQVRHIALHRGAVPSFFEGQVTLSAHQRAADYNLARLQLGLAEIALSAALLLGWTVMGGLDALHQLLLAWMGAGMWQQLGLLAAFVLINAAIELPLDAASTFGVEQRFGFNKASPGLWLADLFRSALVMTLIGLPLAWGILWLMARAGSQWWLWAWLFWVGFSLLLMWVYPTWIAPVFNRFQPLEDVQTRERVSKLLTRCGFSAKGLFVMDGSRRSAHANAYFTGLGRAKRVVFFDTLLQRLNVDELEAVLAHELGHFHHRHVLKRMLGLFGLSLLGFALLGWLSQQVWFYTGLGVRPQLDAPNDALALLLFLLVIPLFSFLLAPVMAASSRRHEFEADAYACAQTQASNLRSALLRLHEDNASTLTPDPWYVRFHYSHPPALQRLERLA